MTFSSIILHEWRWFLFSFFCYGVQRLDDEMNYHNGRSAGLPWLVWPIFYAQCNIMSAIVVGKGMVPWYLIFIVGASIDDLASIRKKGKSMTLTMIFSQLVWCWALSTLRLSYGKAGNKGTLYFSLHFNNQTLFSPV